MSGSGFQGFPKQTLAFYRELAANNDKMWFEEHRDDFENHVMEPARALVVELGKRLKKIAPGIHADPRVNKSLFKINRDIRFSKDKTPYKTHLALWFWEGSGKRMECSGFYFHLEPGKFRLGCGLYQFPKNLVDEYRKSVVDPKHGPALARAINKVKKTAEIGGKHFKKTPRGFDPDHKYAEYLLYNGLYAGTTEIKPPPELHTPELADYCFEQYKPFKPLHEWLFDMTERRGE